MPSGLLANVPAAPSQPMRASREVDEISIPQMIRVTVTCLVCAIGCLATVRSYVTWAAVPVLSDGGEPPQDEREPSARGGTDASVPPLRQFPSEKCRWSRYTRMTALVLLWTLGTGHAQGRQTSL